MLVERFDVDPKLSGRVQRFVPSFRGGRSIRFVSDRLLDEGECLVPLRAVLLVHCRNELVTGLDVRREAAKGKSQDEKC